MNHCVRQKLPFKDIKDLKVIMNSDKFRGYKYMLFKCMRDCVSVCVCYSRACLATRRQGLAPQPLVHHPLALAPGCLATSLHSPWALEPTHPPLVLPSLQSKKNYLNNIRLLTVRTFVTEGFGTSTAGGSLFGNKPATGGLGTGLGTTFGTGTRGY